LKSTSVTKLGEFERLFREHGEAGFWDIRIADMTSTQDWRLFYGDV